MAFGYYYYCVVNRFRILKILSIHVTQIRPGISYGCIGFCVRRGAGGKGTSQAASTETQPVIKVGYWDKGIDDFHIVFALKKLFVRISCLELSDTETINQPRKPVLGQSD